MPDPVQQQHQMARKNQILDAATVVFSQKGFHPTTTRDIARQAGIAEGTIYNYFPSKTALLLGIFERMKESALHEAQPLAQDAPDFPSFVRTYLRQPIDELRENDFALFRILLSESMVNEELRTRYEHEVLQPTLEADEQHFLEQAARHGFTLDRPKLAVRFISTLMLGLIMEQVLHANTSDDELDELLNYVARLLVRDKEQT